jgi:hypothetical protein
MGWMQGSSNAQATASKDPANPLKSPDSSTSDSSPRKAAGDGSTASRGSSDSDNTASGGFKSAAIDPALRKSMMEELKYEPADQREKLFAEWSKFDAAFIRELIENHRAARELAQSRGSGTNPDWGNGPSVKTVAKGQTPGAPVFDDPTAPNDSVLRDRTPAPKATQPTATQSLGAVSPWDDAASASQSGRGAAASTPARPPLAQASAAPAGPIAPPAGATSKSDIWDFDSPTRKPAASDRAAVASASLQPGQNAAGTTTSPSATTPAPAAPPPKGDAFAGLPPVDTEPAPAATRTPGVNAPGMKVAAVQGGAAPAPSRSSDPFGDGPSIQTGAAAPGNVVANLQTSSLNPAAPVTQAVGTGTTGSGIALAAATTAAASGQSGSADTEQPVKLSSPVEIPDGQVVAATDSPASGTRASQAAATGAPSPAPQPSTTQQPSGLASLPGRLLGAINPLPGTGGSRNVSLPANWHDELQKIVTVAATEAGQTSVGTSDADKLAYIQKQVNLRMLYLLSGQPARSLEPIAGLEPADQEFWQEVFWGMSSYFDRNTIADPQDRATQTIAQLRQAVHKLQEKSKLELRNVSFCNKIENYGRYERFKRDEFTAGQPVLLYAEVENFKSEPTADGPYRAILKSTIEIFDSGGKRVVSMPFAPNEDLCASPRRDYYNSYEFSIPQQISLGPHTLKLTVEDQLSQKIASYSVNFTVK